MQRNIDENNRTLEETQAQIQFRTEERDNLQVDKAKFNYELEQVTQYHTTLQKKLTTTKEELSRLYRQNYLLAEELAKLTRQMTE